MISRCSLNANVTWEGFLLKECNLIETFLSNALLEVMVKDGMYIPRNCNFPAIDLCYESLSYQDVDSCVCLFVCERLSRVLALLSISTKSTINIL